MELSSHFWFSTFQFFSFFLIRYSSFCDSIRYLAGGLYLIESCRSHDKSFHKTSYFSFNNELQHCCYNTHKCYEFWCIIIQNFENERWRMCVSNVKFEWQNRKGSTSAGSKWKRKKKERKKNIKDEFTAKISIFRDSRLFSERSQWAT